MGKNQKHEQLLNNELPEDIAQIKRDDFGITRSSCGRLRRLGVETFEDLLKIDYKDLGESFGEQGLKGLKNYVHSLGYTLKNEKESLNEIIERKKQQGIQLLEDLGFTRRIYQPLYKSGIYSIEDLLDSDFDIHLIPNFGPSRQQELINTMKQLNLSFHGVVEMEPVPEVLPFVKAEEAIKIIQKENEESKARIERKQQLIEEYNKLLEEKQALILKEQALDAQIEEKTVKMESLKRMNHVKK